MISALFAIALWVAAYLAIGGVTFVFSLIGIQIQDATRGNQLTAPQDTRWGTCIVIWPLFILVWAALGVVTFAEWVRDRIEQLEHARKKPQ